MSDTVFALSIIGLLLNEQKKKKRKRRYWVKPWLSERETFTHERLLRRLRDAAPDDYRNFLRMDCVTFEDLLSKVTPFIERQNTKMRDAIPANERLSATLRFLATGNSYEDMKFHTTISPQTLGRIIIETCHVIKTCLKEYIQVPKTESGWKNIARDFDRKWNFPNCIGAIDGKHVQIRKPPGSGSSYFNYKKSFSIVLLAIVNANYEIIMGEVGATGRISDGGIFSISKFNRKMEDNELNIPAPEELPHFPEKMPFVLIGDDAFPLRTNLMKPFSRTNLTPEEEICNYRFSRARRVVENFFGILSARFRVLQHTINLSPEKCTTIVLACCYLHNYLSKKRGEDYREGPLDGEDLITGHVIKSTFSSQEQLIPLEASNSRNSSASAKETRNKFKEYFNTVGTVPWQYGR